MISRPIWPLKKHILSVPRFDHNSIHNQKMQPAKRQRSASVAASSHSVDISEFDNIVEEMSSYDQQRETVRQVICRTRSSPPPWQPALFASYYHKRRAVFILTPPLFVFLFFLKVIKRSRDIQKLSKQAIYSLHRGDDNDASNKLKLALTAAVELAPLISQSPSLRHGSFSNSIEEYAEAVILRTYLQDGRVATREEVQLAEVEEYLGGVLDFTGELNRIAVAKATVRDKEAVQKARDVVETLQGQFLRFDLRNGALRKKYDALKYTLRKLENTLYELSLTENGLASKPDDVPDIIDAGGGGEDGL
jgi:predicted translin family RNA/ssDNA-binding protein